MNSDPSPSSERIGKELTLPPPLCDLVLHLKVCDYGCCGSDAFDTSPEKSLEWLPTVSPESHQRCLEQLEEVLGPLYEANDTVYVPAMSAVLDPLEALCIFADVKDALEAALHQYAKDAT